MTEDINWKEELLDSALFNKKQANVLKYGPKSLHENWLTGVLYTRWKKLKGIRPDPEPSDCSSSFKEWNKKVEEGKNR